MGLRLNDFPRTYNYSASKGVFLWESIENPSHGRLVPFWVGSRFYVPTITHAAKDFFLAATFQAPQTLVVNLFNSRGILVE